MDQPQFFNPRSEVTAQENRLPHWEQDGCSYFLTFRLADSLPKGLLDEWTRERKIWLRLNPKPWSAKQEQEYHERFSGSKERWLDAMHGECLLKQPDAREPLVDKLAENTSTIWSYVIMPNHVHLLVSLADGIHLEDWIQLLKGGSSYAINRRMNRKGKLWAKDYFDRLVRDSGHFSNCARYIRKNPVKARLVEGGYAYFASEYVEGLLGSCG